MAFLKKINTRAKVDDNTGLGSNSQMYGDRFFRKDGKPNIRKTGIALLERNSWYHTLLQMPRWKFLATIFLTYIVINLFFALIYLSIGVDKLSGMLPGSPAEKFGEAFFFSAQTFTTVGYGRLSPTGFWMSFIASTQALIGLLSFALATGLFYGRFSKPKAYIRFSKNALIAPFKDTIALMVRLVPYKNNSLTEGEAKLTLAMMVEENGVLANRFFTLPLELSKITALNLSWTLVHIIDENSPFYGLSKEDLIVSRAEIIVFMKAFDDYFSNTVVARSSYRAQELVVGAKFIPMFHRDERNGTTVLELDKLNDYSLVDISNTNMMKVDSLTSANQ